VSTQTVAVLAELAGGENTGAGIELDTSDTPDSERHILQASGFCVESLTLKVIQYQKLDTRSLSLTCLNYINQQDSFHTEPKFVSENISWFKLKDGMNVIVFPIFFRQVNNKFPNVLALTSRYFPKRTN